MPSDTFHEDCIWTFLLGNLITIHIAWQKNRKNLLDRNDTKLKCQLILLVTAL